MITEQQLDEMARERYPGTSSLDHTMRETWKKAYKWKEKHNPPPTDEERMNEQLPPIGKAAHNYGRACDIPAYVGNPSLPAERIQNGLQYQEEMLKRGFEKIGVVVAVQPNWLPLPKVEVNTDAAREHFQHVHALIANTATQQAYRQTIAAIEPLLTIANSLGPYFPGHTAPYEIANGLNSHIMHLHHCLAELEAQFADLEQKIFGTDKPAEQ